MPLETDEWGIDVVVSGSQKALMTPPGLALASVSRRGAEAAARQRRRGFYFDWERDAEGAGEARRARSRRPSRSSRGLDVALGLLLESGLEAAFERHARLGRACREGVKAMGLELFSPDEDRSAVVTAIRAPDGVDADELLQPLRDRSGVTLARRPGRAEGQDLPHRPHRLVRHLRHHDRARGRRARRSPSSGATIERGVAVTRALEAYSSTRRV